MANKSKVRFLEKINRYIVNSYLKFEVFTLTNSKHMSV